MTTTQQQQRDAITKNFVRNLLCAIVALLIFLSGVSASFATDSTIIFAQPDEKALAVINTLSEHFSPNLQTQWVKVVDEEAPYLLCQLINAELQTA